MSGSRIVDKCLASPANGGRAYMATGIFCRFKFRQTKWRQLQETPLKIARQLLTASAAVLFVSPTFAQIIFYENSGFSGRTFTVSQQVANFERYGFNDRASSAVVMQGRWEACENARYEGRCMVLRPGRYDNLSSMGLNDRVSSVRMVDRASRIESSRYAPWPTPVYDNRRRNDERLYEAEVTYVRAVVGHADRRCWMEREQLDNSNGEINAPGAVAGALLGGILGHQVGSGRGNDVATVVGAVAGGTIGAGVGRGENKTRGVQRCEPGRSDARADYWDVSYVFRGQEHRVQMAYPPGRTVTVNRRGEPRAN